MDTSQVWRFPKKYGELFKNISNEDIGRIIKALFLGDVKDLNGLNKAYYDIIKVDLDNLEKSAINGKKGGRPRKEEITETPGYENKKPQVIENDNLKERERERERERESKEKGEEEIYRQFKHLSLSVKEFNKLNETYTKEAIDDILDSIENYKKNKDYVNLYLTANKWLKKESPKKPVKKYDFSNMSKNELVDLWVETKGSIQPALREYNYILNAEVEHIVKARDYYCGF